MKRHLLIIILLLLSISVSAQLQRGLKSSYNLDSFPQVSFVWNMANPEVLSKSQVVLYEENNLVDFQFSVCPIDKGKPLSKSVLILWEDMASHSRQSDFTREVLSRFFREAKLAATDRFEVAVFDRKKDNTPLLTPFVGQFTENSGRLADAVAAHKNNNRQYSSFPQSSDLYLAINEGISMLKKEPADRVGVIIVVTAGLNVKASGASTEMETVRRNALEAGIPIYVLKYPLSGDTPEVNVLAESTYGLSFSSIDADVAVSNLKQQYSGMDDRLRGCDYKIIFKSSAKHDGKPYRMQLMVDRVRQPLPPVVVPPSPSVVVPPLPSIEAHRISLTDWISDYWWLLVLVSLLVVGVIVWVVLLIKMKNKERDAATQAMQEQMRREQEESERRNRELVDNMKREQESKERAARETAARERMAAEEERLAMLMRTKNIYPRLQCKAGNETFSYTIGKPRVTIGRNADNDVAFTMKDASFNNQTISGLHAEIVFNGFGFELINKSHSYTQGIIVNGQFYQKYMLSSGDMIGLGEAIITFYV